MKETFTGSLFEMNDGSFMVTENKTIIGTTGTDGVTLKLLMKGGSAQRPKRMLSF